MRNIRHKTLAKEVAKQSIVLLKNNGILPLSKNLKSISVIGPTADNVYNQLGDYTAPQDTNQVITVLKDKACSFSDYYREIHKRMRHKDTTQSNIDEAVNIAKMSDAVVLVVEVRAQEILKRNIWTSVPQRSAIKEKRFRIWNRRRV